MDYQLHFKSISRPAQVCFSLRFKKIYYVIFLFCFFPSFSVYSQTEITATYINNPDFSINSNYTSFDNDTIPSASPPIAEIVEGWNLTTASSWGASSTFQYGFDGLLNGSSIPINDPSGSTTGTNAVLGISTGWGGEIIYSQQVTLPAGLYTMEIISTFENGSDIGANLTGWSSEEVNIFSDFNYSAAPGTWDTTSISMRLTEETTGTVQVGIRALNAGTGSNARVFTDAIKLYNHQVTKDTLQVLVNHADTLLVNPEPVPPGSTAYADLENFVEGANIVLENANATASDILKNEDWLRAAIIQVSKDIYDAGLDVYDNYSATVSSINDSIKLTGKGQLTITSSVNPINGVIDLYSENAWIYLPNIIPSEVVDEVLDHITINADMPVVGQNIRLTNYLNGTMIMAHSNSYVALNVFERSGQSGDQMDIMIDQHYKAAELGSMNDNIESFILKRGYMATFAVNENGTGGSRVYIADKADVIIDDLPEGLINKVSMVVVRQWRWTTKKGWRGSAVGGSRFNSGSHYDYNNAAYSTLDVEYVPMRHNPNWNSYGNFYDKYSSTHALGYNEPDNSVDDGYSTVADAIAAWPTMMESGLRLGSPATTDGGLNWTYDFIDQADALGYRVDFVAWHFYRAGRTAQQLYDQLLAIHNRTGRPIWITEFNNGCNWTYNGNEPGLQENAQVIQEFLSMLEDAPFVERYYIWDGCNETLRMTNSSTGELYPAGIVYRDQISTMAYNEDYYNSVATIVIQEGETGYCSLEGTIDTNHPYTGSGFSNTTNTVGSGINYKVNFISEGTQTLTVNYASSTDRPANIMVNDSIVVSNAAFLATGGFDQYSEISINIPTQPGTTDLRIEATTAEGLGNIDYVEITGAYPANCDPNPTYPLIISATDEQDGNEAEKILDGNNADNSRWSANGFPQTVIIDYGENKSITGTRVSTYQDRAYQYTIELADNLYFNNAYEVDRSTNTNNDQPIADNFPAISARYVKLTITGASGYSGVWTSITEFEIVDDSNSTLSVLSESESISAEEIQVYPNPTYDYIHVDSKQKLSNFDISIFDLSGNKLREMQLPDESDRLDLSRFKQGIYIIKVKTGAVSKEFKIIKK